MSKYWSSIVHELKPYIPGEQPKVQELVKLNTNENPYGPSPASIKAMELQATELIRLYPDPNSDHLRRAISDFYQVDSAKVFVGNGSDEVLAHTFQALLKQDKPLLFPDITYSFYPVYCGLFGVDSVQIPLNENFEIEIMGYKRENGGILFANPNAPTGHLLEFEKIETLLGFNQDSIVVVDEAYIDFGGKSAIKLVDQYENLLVIQTLSKSRSLAGLRVGFAIGNEILIDALERVKNSFNSYPLSKFAIYGAAESFRDREYFEITRRKIISSREKMSVELQKRGFEVIPSSANFVFARNEDFDAAELCRDLRNKKILVRHFNKPRISQFLRITIGTDEQCAKLLSALDEILSTSNN